MCQLPATISVMTAQQTPAAGAPADTSEPPWLGAPEQRVWRRWMQANALISLEIARAMARDSDISIQDFEVLVHLTDVPEGRVRMSELASTLTWERSRVSHHIRRMEVRALVARALCEEDGRGAYVEITPAGRAAIEAAAPPHVRAVRALFFDRLTADEVASLDTITTKLLDGLTEQPACD